MVIQINFTKNKTLLIMNTIVAFITVGSIVYA
jgi:hypothetical protein